jgi:predicted RNase H-like nuclease (RuvC/YqgF family)
MIKRLVNIYKIFKIIEVLSNKVGLKSNEQTKAILSVLSLSACYPDLIREVFDDLDIQFEELESQLEGLKQEEKQQQMQKLKLLDSLLKTLESLLNTSEEKDAPHLQREYRRLHHDATILLSGITLAQFDLETFNLVRSFCFFGDVGYSPEDSQRTVRSHQG